MSISNTTSPTIFEAPPTAATSEFNPIPPLSASRHKRPFSIDLSLELERQLDMESLPPTPARNTTETTQEAEPLPERDILDPHVLAHIVMQLRHSLTDMTKERDDLLSRLSIANSEEAHFRDALQLVTDKATSLEEELSEARRKMRDDEESISMLRIKVEESRRGLMRLQTESRRQSIQPIDLSRASLVNFASPPSAKRQSFTPLTGSLNTRPNSHKRLSSVSDSGYAGLLDLNTSPGSQIVSLPDHPPSASKRFSGLFGRSSPPQDDAPFGEVLALKKEVEALKAELEDSRRELAEATEAKDASDTCAKALRDFITENNVGTNGSAVPPVPASANDQPSSPSSQRGGWGFKLWKVDTSVKTPSGPASSSSATPTTSMATPTAAPLSRKIGGFFGMQQPADNQQPPLPEPSRGSVYSASDASSIAEPLSPLSDSSVNVMVRDGATTSEVGSNLGHEQK
ncbi:hypothetical protein D9758_005983 [Tetrapyrgos nigripes]|uniref:Uncharacterized protein n=1 Tax=Tetrapyrgos nigripes TaxID=182062 RepID=A0A8H5D9T9_9AGAR|nr:hypothetical protein D9758_005983 [Tetrapyrgos nigripes]